MLLLHSSLNAEARRSLPPLFPALAVTPKKMYTGSVVRQSPGERCGQYPETSRRRNAAAGRLDEW